MIISDIGAESLIAENDIEKVQVFSILKRVKLEDNISSAQEIENFNKNNTISPKIRKKNEKN